ncbi:MAG TPA: universal stress protein [Candidatus Limnocylindrales bacterium]|nr:universal stress protein [Candidatus Limnocylindrales bacterium]
MSEDRGNRPTGEEMLARVSAEAQVDEGRPERGRLRLYLGMAPGVGKTYRMLEEGHRRLERGTDIVVGFVEVHGRPRTAALLDGLEILPRVQVAYQGVQVEEMDTAAIVARHPEVVLIDELAHTNVPGSANEKRWQDVELIRDAGIDVISTCNVQHLESVADAVATIVGAPVNERLPDEVVDTADEVELVDMSPHALRQRIRHGNVYPPDRARVALDRFFTEPNLTALRELSLRFVTRAVDDQLEEIVSEQGLGRLRPVSERVLVLVDERPISRRALRRGAMLATALGAGLSAAVIVTPSVERLPFDRARDLQEHLDYAADLGAQVVQHRARDVVSGLVELGKGLRVTHVVMGRESRRGIARRLGPDLSEQLLDSLPEIEVHLVGEGVAKP